MFKAWIMEIAVPEESSRIAAEKFVEKDDVRTGFKRGFDFEINNTT